MEALKTILQKVVDEYIKHPNDNQQNMNAKNFMERTGIGYKDIYEDLKTDEDGADHYIILTDHFIPSMTDGEIETTVNSVIAKGMDNVL